MENRYVDEELVRLTNILFDELSGTPIDREEARSIILNLKVACPVIGATLGMIDRRLMGADPALSTSRSEVRQDR